MSKAFNDPSLLTKDRLKHELESNGVKLPRVEQKKDFYVKLYRENLSPRSGQRSGHGGFSSDEDDFEPPPQDRQLVPRASRSIRKIGSKDIVSADIKSMTDEELKEELSSLGQIVGPIMPSTRDLYERKLARVRSSMPNNGTTVTSITRTEFSDNDFDEEMQDEESAPDDEFFYSHQSRSRGSTGGPFGATFMKNFRDTSTKKEVMRDFSVSSSSNVEHSSSFDRQTKVRTKKGDKFEEKNWSFAGRNGDDGGDDGDDVVNDALSLPRLPPNIQKAITSARFSSEESPASSEPEMRARPSQRQKSKIPENIPKTESREEKPKQQKIKEKKSRWRWLLIFFLALLILAAAVAYNLEGVPNFNEPFRSLPESRKPPRK